MLVALKRAVFGEQTVEGEIHVQGLYMMLKMTWSECKCDKISYVTRVNGPFPVHFAMFAGATFYKKKNKNRFNLDRRVAYTANVSPTLPTIVPSFYHHLNAAMYSAMKKKY